MNPAASVSSGTAWRDCPCCGYKKALSVTVKDGRELFYCHAGCSQADVLAALRGHGGKAVYSPPPAPARDVSHIKDYALKLWRDSLSGREGLVPVYLASRGLIGVVPDSLRFLPNHPHKPSGTSWPVMLAAVTDTKGNVLALHRTYLAKDGRGKAPVEPAKMTLGPVGGLSCHLAPAGEELIVSEGIETGLAVQFPTLKPTWSAISAGGIRKLVLPPLPLASSVVIAADNDANGCGQRAALEAALRWRKEGRRVRIALPPEGMDFNDVIMKGAKV